MGKVETNVDTMVETQVETEIDKLWESHRTRHDAVAREQLILYYAPLVRRVASRLPLIESASADRQDLIGHGITGLIEAIDRYDPGRATSFETFASSRIRGSILDALRVLDYLPRSVRRRATEIERAIATLLAADGEMPADEKIAEFLGLDLETCREVLEQANIVFLSLDSPLSDLQKGNEEMILGEALEDTTVRDTMEEVEERHLRLELIAAVRDLPQREQLVLSLYYYEELTVREVAEVVNLSPSRVSQLLAKAIMFLRARLIYGCESPRPAVRGRPAVTAVAGQ